MTTTACTDYETNGTVAGYAAGTLAAARVGEFERHLIGCAACQDSVRLAAGTRVALRDTAPRAGYVAATRPGRHRLMQFAWAAAAVIAIVFAGNGWLDRRAVQRLGSVTDMPAYQGIEVRASTQVADTLFVNAMRLYQAGRFHESLPLLLAARERGADVAATSFFIGVMELRAGRQHAAVAALSQSLGHESPYAPEARYYTAKAWLQLADADSARPHLEQAGRTDDPIAAAARALADSLAVRRR